MSYILDALRRADAERERGHVPGLHSNPLQATGPAPVARRRRWPLAAGAVLAMGLLGALVWVLTQPPPGAPPPATPVVAAAPAPAAVPMPPPLAQVAPALVPAGVPPPPGHLFPPAPLPPDPVPAVKPAPREAAVPSPASSPAPVVTAAPRIVPLAQLPDDVKSRIPPLAIGGAIWSEQASQRMLIVGGQLLHEGDAAGPGVVLEQIRQKSAVLRWNDVRYEVSF